MGSPVAIGFHDKARSSLLTLTLRSGSGEVSAGTNGIVTDDSVYSFTVKRIGRPGSASSTRAEHSVGAPAGRSVGRHGSSKLSGSLPSISTVNVSGSYSSGTERRSQRNEIP